MAQQTTPAIRIVEPADAREPNVLEFAAARDRRQEEWEAATEQLADAFIRLGKVRGQGGYTRPGEIALHMTGESEWLRDLVHARLVDRRFGGEQL